MVNRLKRRITYLLLFLPVGSLFAQNATITGRITDETGSGLPFATIYIENSSSGTSSNDQGYYQLNTSPGNKTLVFRYVGYRSIKKEVQIIPGNNMINVSLEPEIVELKEVVITAGEEDPAYAIIRKVIQNKDKYLREIESFTADVYIKGLQRLDEAPKKFLGINIDLDTGIIYLSESVSKLSFEQPDKYKERMISSKVSGENNAFSYNQATDMDVNFYENIVMQELNQRGFISPLSNSAFLFYDYELIGTFSENDQLVHKIKVIPRRPNDPSFSGFIYILEGSWRIHSVDLLLTRSHQIEFIDSLEVNQVYTQVQDNTWMLLSQQFSFQFKVFGFEGSGYFVGVLSNYNISPELGNKYFDNEVIVVEEESNKREDDYWANIRPMPLTLEEQRDYQVKDSLREIKESKPYRDSVDRVNNKITAGNIFLSGYSFENSYKKETFSLQPVTSMFQFNTVEGVTADLRFSYSKSFEDNRFYRFRPEIRYGFDNKKIQGQMQALYYYNPKKFSYGSISFGRFIEQFNGDEPISPLVNTIYTLVEKKNFMKLYQNGYVQIRHRSEIVNGIRLTTTLSFNERKRLQNSSDFSIANDDRQFTSNDPVNLSLTDTSFPTHQALMLNLEFRFRVNQKYASRPYRKIILGSKFPTFYLNYEKGINNIFGSDIDFDFISGRITESKSFGLVGRSVIRLEAGTFINKDSLAFMDFKHFNGNKTIFGNFSPGSFQLLDYYFFSTENRFFQAHFEHHFNGFIFNKFPLVRKLKPQMVFTVSYLNTENGGDYFEIGAGIEHILKILRVDFFISFDDSGRNNTGFVFGFGF